MLCTRIQQNIKKGKEMLDYPDIDQLIKLVEDEDPLVVEPDNIFLQ